MRRSSHPLRDLGVTLVVAASLVFVPPPARVLANTSCTVQEWGSWSGPAAQMNVGWGSNVGTWSVWITPAGTLAGLLNGPRRDSPGTRIGGGTGSSGSFTWNTYAFPNGLYDIAFTYVRGTGSGGSYAYCALRIANVPSAPSPVTVSPTSNTLDVFDASWGASVAPGGLAYYEYFLDCNWSARSRTTSTGLRLTGFVRVRGPHVLCVRAVDRAGMAGHYTMSKTFYLAYITPSLSFTAPSTVNAGSAITLTALLRDPSGRPIANKDVRFNTGWGASTSWRTDASGNAAVTLPVTSIAGTYRVQVESPADATYAYDSAARQVTVQRTIASTTMALTAPSTVQARSGVPFTVTLLTTDSRPVPSRTVRVSLGSYSAPLTTGPDGRVSATILSPDMGGTYQLLVRFDGDPQYLASTASRQLQVIPDTTRPSIPAISVSPTASTTNAFRVSWPASTDTGTGVGRYEVRVNGALYRTVTSVGSGVHTTEVRAPGVGLHRVEVQAIDRGGNPSGWSQPATFEMLRQTATLAIDFLPSSAARCSSVDFRARLTSESTPLAGRVVSLRIGGTGATAMTDGAGIATATIALDIAPGPYTATASYAGDAVLPASQATQSIQVTGSASESCTPTGGGGPPGGGTPPGGGQGQTSQGGLSVGIPAR